MLMLSCSCRNCSRTVIIPTVFYHMHKFVVATTAGMALIISGMIIPNIRPVLAQHNDQGIRTPTPTELAHAAHVGAAAWDGLAAELGSAASSFVHVTCTEHIPTIR
jgi:hypothetical protein